MSSLIVLAPPTSRALVSVDAVRAQYGVTQAQIPDDRIKGMISAASAMASVYCRRQFGLQTVRERLSITPGCVPVDQIVVGMTPIVELRSVAASGDMVDPAEYEHTDCEVFNLDDDGEHVPWYGRSFTLIYQAGYVLPGMDRTVPGFPTAAQDLPADIARAVMLLIGVSVSGSDRDIMIKAEETEGVGRTEYYVQGQSASLPHPEAEAILRGYKLANV